MSEESQGGEVNLDHLEFNGLSPLAQDAASMHEIFLALCGAGFTEQQALTLTALLTDGGSGRPQQDVDDGPEFVQIEFTFDDEEDFEDEELDFPDEEEE